MSNQELLVISIPAILLIAVIVAAILTRGKKKIKTEENKPEQTPETKAETIPAVCEMSNAELIKEVKKSEQESLVKIKEAVRLGIQDGLKGIQLNPVIPTDPNIDPMDIVYPANSSQDVGISSNVTVEPLTLFEKITKTFWSFAPGILAVLATLYLLQGYVKVPNYAADSKGLNERMTYTENTSIPQINKSLSGITTQINSISSNISAMQAKEQTLATGASLVDANNNIAKLQSDLKNVSVSLQALQVSVSLLEKSQNTTSNVTGNVTK